MTEDEARYCFI